MSNVEQISFYSAAEVHVPEVLQVVAEHFGLKEIETLDSRWYERGVCAQTDPDAFHPTKGRSGSSAQSVCDTCEVKPECLIDVLEGHSAISGVWGGTSSSVRRDLLKEIAALRKLRKKSA